MLCMPMSHGSRRAPFTHWKGRPRLCLRYGPRAHPSGFPSMSRLPSSLHSATSRLPVRSIPLPRGVTLAAFISASQLSEFQLSVVYVARSPPASLMRSQPARFRYLAAPRLWRSVPTGAIQLSAVSFPLSEQLSPLAFLLSTSRRPPRSLFRSNLHEPLGQEDQAGHLTPL